MAVLSLEKQSTLDDSPTPVEFSGRRGFSVAEDSRRKGHPYDVSMTMVPSGGRP